MIRDNCGYMYVDIAMPEDLNFLAAILKCDFKYVHNGFQLNGKRYSTIEIIREDSANEDQNSGNRVLFKEQVV